jgi:hypothetical protein
MVPGRDAPYTKKAPAMPGLFVNVGFYFNY